MVLKTVFLRLSVMIEAFAQEVSSERFCEAVRFGFKKVCHEKRY